MQFCVKCVFLLHGPLNVLLLQRGCSRKTCNYRFLNGGPFNPLKMRTSLLNSNVKLQIHQQETWLTWWYCCLPVSLTLHHWPLPIRCGDGDEAASRLAPLCSMEKLGFNQRKQERAGSSACADLRPRISRCRLWSGESEKRFASRWTARTSETFSTQEN